MKTLQGIGASPGKVVGPVFLFQQEDLSFKTAQVSDPQAEWKRMEQAFQTAFDQLEQIYDREHRFLANVLRHVKRLYRRMRGRRQTWKMVST